MAERYLIFDSQSGDRAITAEDFAEWFVRLSDDGYFRTFSQELEVVPNSPTDLSVNVSQGAAMIRGRFYQLFDEVKNLTISTPDVTDDRIDRIILRLDLNTRDIVATVLTGTPDPSPTAPALTQDATTWELSLAQILVSANATTIEAGDITDERDDETVCGVSVHRGSIPVTGGTMEGDLNLNGNAVKGVLRLFFEDRDENDVIIGMTESGSTGELLFATYNANNFTVNSLFAILETSSSFQIDRIRGFTDAEIVRFGSGNQGDKRIDATGSAVRLQYDSQNYVLVSDVAVAFYFNGSQVHRFNDDGSKVAGSIKIDDEVLGMSPTDSPRSLIEDLMFDVEVKTTKKVPLDPRFAKAINGYSVFCSNPNVQVYEKGKDFIKLKGSGTTDLHITGKRYDKKDQYFVNMQKGE